MNRSADLIFSDVADSFYGRRCRYFEGESDVRRYPAGGNAANMKKHVKNLSLQGYQPHGSEGLSGGRPAQKPSKSRRGKCGNLSSCVRRPPTPVRHGSPAEKLFLTLVTGPAAANVLMSHHARPVPNTHVRHGPPAEKLFLTLVTAPGAPVPHTHVRHGPPAEKLFLTLITGPGAANVLTSCAPRT